MTFREEPAFFNRDREMIPRALLRGMLALVLFALALTVYAVATERPLVGQPEASAPTAERMLVLKAGPDQAVTVLTPEGQVLADLAHGGFVTVIQNGLQTQRRRHGIDPLLPVRLVQFENGRLTVEDPATGWSVELYAFGGDNRAAFARFLQP
jgi:putative photosynthetic complex assembly protein